MSRLTKKHSKKQGSPPGSLIYIGERDNSEQKITVVSYNQDNLFEKKETSLGEAITHISKKSVTWINVSGIHEPKVIETLGHRFNWSPLVMEDILNTGQRPKCDDYKDYLYLVLRFFHKCDNLKIDDQQFSLVLGTNYVITFMESTDEILDPVRVRIRRNGSRMRYQGVDYLAYAIIDTIVDSTFTTLEKIDDEVEKLENELFTNPSPKTIFNIQRFRKEIALLRKNLWPMREAISGLERKENALVTDNTRYFLRDVHDHLVLMIETIEGFRDVLAGMIDIYLSTINLKMNEIMKVLTIMTTLFVPLTFIASIYGMNFEIMPELHNPYGYPIVLGVMAAVAMSMLYFFHRKKWI